MSDQERGAGRRKRCSDTCDCGYVQVVGDAWRCMGCGKLWCVITGEAQTPKPTRKTRKRP